MQEVGCVVVVGNVIDVPFGVDQGCAVLLALFVDFQWASGGRSKFLGEWASLRNRMVLLWACSCSIECIKCTLPATPLQRTWLNESGWLSFTSWMSFMWFTRSFVLISLVLHLRRKPSFIHRECGFRPLPISPWKDSSSISKLVFRIHDYTPYSKVGSTWQSMLLEESGLRVPWKVQRPPLTVIHLELERLDDHQAPKHLAEWDIRILITSAWIEMSHFKKMRAHATLTTFTNNRTKIKSAPEHAADMIKKTA